MAEPKVHEIHFTVAGQSIESGLFREVNPGDLRYFYCPMVTVQDPDQRLKSGNKDIPIESRAAAVTRVLLSKAIKTVLMENFQEDINEVLQDVPELKYADIKQSGGNVSNSNQENFPPIYSDDDISKEDNENQKADSDKLIIYGVSPRIAIPERVKSLNEADESGSPTTDSSSLYSINYSAQLQDVMRYEPLRHIINRCYQKNQNCLHN